MKKSFLAAALVFFYFGLSSQSLTIKKIGEYGTLFYGDAEINGNYAYCLNGDILDIIDVSNPASPFRAGGIITDDQLMNIVIHNGYAFAISFKGMSVFDISSPLHPVVAAKIAFREAMGMEVSGDHAFVTTMNSGIKIIDIQNPLQPEWIGTYSYTGMGGLVRVSGTTMYVVEEGSKISILNIANPLSPVLLGTYIGATQISNFVIGGSHLFLAAERSISIVDVSDPQAPFQTGIYNDAGFPSRLTFRNNYLFVGASGDRVSTFGGIRTINVANPTNPILTGETWHDAYIGGFDLIGDSLFITSSHPDRDFGTDYGLQIYNVTDPALIIPAGSYNTAINPFGIAVKGNYGYVCGSGGMRVIDVSNPLTISQVGMADPPGIGSTIKIEGNYAYVGSGSSGFDIFDLANPTAPTRTGHCSTVASMYRFCLSGQHVFVAAGTSGIQIINVSNPSNPYSVKVYDTPGSVYNVYVNGNYAYVGDGGLGLMILDISDPANPVFVSSTPSLDSVKDVVVSGTIAYVANTDSHMSGTTTGLHVLNIADPAAPVEIAFYHTNQYLERLILSGNYLYALQFYQGLLVLDIGTPTMPAQAGFYPYVYDLDDFVKNGDRVYLADYWDDYKITVLQVHDQYLHLTSPNGETPEPDPEPAERWQVGDSHNITWTGTGNMGNVKLEYSIDDGFIWHTISAATEDDGVYNWTVPDAISDRCLVRVSDPDGVAADASDAVFSIRNDPRLWLTSPIGGESWMVNSIHDITWTSGGPVGSIDIDYTIDSGLNWIPIVSGTANDGVYEWTVPDTPSNTCYMRLRAEGGMPEAQNGTEFSIAAFLGETMSAPNTPSGPATGMEGAILSYSTGGSVSSLGHAVQYRFDWNDGTYSDWLAVGVTEASHAWLSSGTYNVRAMARCSIDFIQSAWSTALPVTLDESPTWAAVSRFQACEAESRPTVEWHTASEIGTIGFNLWRRDRNSGEYELVNPGLLPALPGSPQGGVYRFADPGAFPGEPVVYRLEEIDALGRTRNYGPFTVTFGASRDGSTSTEVQTGREEPSDVYGYQRFPREQSPYEKERLQELRLERQRGTALAAGQRKERARITVKGRGLFYVSAAQVAGSLGTPVAAAAALISGYDLRLTGLGKEIAWLADAGGAGLFFYNEGVETVYSDRNVFFLDKGRGLAMERLGGGNAGTADPDRSYRETLHFEDNRYALLLPSMDPAKDLWFWDYIVAGSAAKPFPIAVPGVASGKATLKASLQGATDTAAENDHHAVISLNGRQVGEAVWAGARAHELEVEFDASLLQDGANTIEVSGVLDSGAPYGTFYVEALDLSYPRYYKAVENRLICRRDGHSAITVSGIMEPQAVVLDVGNPTRPKLLTGVSPDVSGRVSFIPGSAGNAFLVSGLNAALRPLAVAGDRPAELKGPAHSAEYIVIAPEEFAETARQLAKYRQGRKLKSLVVTLEDIYDAFNHGLPSPYAIRDFLAHAYTKWGGKKVKYAVLAGKGTYDYNDYLGYGDNLLPAILGRTPEGLCAADRIYGDVKGRDGLPEIAIGRLPAVSSGELQAMIGKIKAYESAQGEWTDQALFIADNADSGGDFAASCNELAGLATGLRAEKIYLAGPAAETRSRIISSWNAGAALVSYCGHGGIDQLATENIFAVADARALDNGGRLPLATMFTCVAGRFELPGFTSLGEALALNDKGGMAAGLLPSGAAMNTDSLRLGGEFYKAVYRGREVSAGMALLAAMKSYLQQGGPGYLLNVYNWLGDPALEFK